MTYVDRPAAGRSLADALSAYRGRDAVVLALPRGGVPVGAQVAITLDAPLDVVVVRKLGFPGQPELAMGAVGPGGVLVLNEQIAARATPDRVAAAVAAEAAEVDRRERDYRGDRPAIDVTGRVAIVVDDGLATGATMRAAVAVVRALGPAAVVVAVPVGSPGAVQALGAGTEAVVCPWQPEEFRAVGEFYDDFAQTTDDEVRALLAAASAR